MTSPMERIHVTVRVRPLSPEDSNPWKISGKSISMSNHSAIFEFDRIFGEDCRTIDVYEARTRDIVGAAVRGFNGTVFAYGQTNSGKTHTMRGSSVEPGVIPLAVRDLFDTVQEDMDREFLLRMSYMEIYNEEINDLLAPEHRKLQIHESLERGIYVAGLREEIVVSAEQVLELIMGGESHRHIGETNMNLHSSRSHTIFRMIIESRDRTEEQDSDTFCDAVRVSVLNLVDLAGSERAAKTGAEGVRLKEGSHINKSLMTLGTVIKKLSEGAESQGGHVPYRDSKLTRILQPALGGNANTAIICNITPAQIHADETKSSLQFASRALRVTNCARVNEILTDAALLKRQKKEIEELRAKLQGSQSEHFEEEILNLRNTLLQTELERERISLELEEEKKAQAERDRRLQEQAKKIENLSSMVLYSNRDENREQFKKEKRRDTWCPGKALQGTLREGCPTIHSKASTTRKLKHGVGSLLLFEELLNEPEFGVDESFRQHKENSTNTLVEDCPLPDPRALLHVTNRRKVSTRKNSFVGNDDILKIQAEYEDLLLTCETQRTVNEIQIDFLTRKLNEVSSFVNKKYDEHASHHGKITSFGDNFKSPRDSEAILMIKQLQEKINTLGLEKFSSQANLDNVVELATEQNICAKEKYEELYEKFLKAREEASIAQVQEQLDSMINLVMEFQEIFLDVENSRSIVDDISFVMDELFQGLEVVFGSFMEFKSLTKQYFVQLKSVVNGHGKLQHYVQQKVTEFENEKLLLHDECIDLRKEMEEVKLNAQNYEHAFKELSVNYNLEKSELFSHIQLLESELSRLSSSSMIKENEALRKDLEKAKVKLKETESKLKNVIQEKTKLESEKAHVEREVKQLRSQKALLERDLNKRDELAGRRRDSFFDSQNRAKAHAIISEQGDDSRIEVYTFELEATISSLEEELEAAYGAKEEAASINQSLSCELKALSEELNLVHSELSALQEEASGLRVMLEESESKTQKMENSMNMLEKEKQELAMQFANALMEMEVEKALWLKNAEASVEVIAEKTKSFNTEMTLLSEKLLMLMDELNSCKEECKVLEERLASSEQNFAQEKICSAEKSFEIDRLRNDLQLAALESNKSQNILTSKFERLSLEHFHACEEKEMLKNKLSFLHKEREDLLTPVEEPDMDLKDQLFYMTKERNDMIAQIKLQGQTTNLQNSNNQLVEANTQVEELSKRISSLEIMIHDAEVGTNNERAKHRMRLHWSQAKLDAFRRRHKDAIDEFNYMHKKYDEASKILKDRLALSGVEILNLKKELALKG